MRTIITLPEEQAETLAQFAAKTKRSKASLIREALAEYLAKHASGQEERAFGLWKGRGVEGLEYQRNLRAEWE
jgi:predicted transcriptional regulator